MSKPTRNRLVPVVWSRAWRGYLWHARRALAVAGPSIVDDPNAACGFRPGDGCRQGGRVSSWSPRRCQWVDTTEREPRPTRRATNGQWLHDMRCSACLRALEQPPPA